MHIYFVIINDMALRHGARQRGCHRLWRCAVRKIIGLEAFWIVAHLFATELGKVRKTDFVC